MERKDFKPGRYVLTSDIINPHPDRRSRDWAKRPKFFRGEEFNVTKFSLGDITGIPSDTLALRPPDSSHRDYTFSPSRSPKSITNKNEVFELILAALEPTTESAENFFDRNHPAASWWPVKRLLDAKKITEADVFEIFGD